MHSFDVSTGSYRTYPVYFGLVQKRLILGNKDNRRPALIFMRVLTI